MRFLPVILLSLTLAAGRNIPNAKYRKQLEKVLGKPLDISVINRIVIDEAKKLGIPAQEHFQHCLLEDEDAKEAKLINEGYNEFMKKVDGMRFSSIDNVMGELKKQAPKVYAAFNMIFTDFIAPLDTEAAMFVVKVKQSLVTMLYNHSKMSPRMSPRRRAAMYGKSFKKIFADYDALSPKAKIDFEKNTCFRTMLRILDATGKYKGMIGELKKEINDLIRLA